MSTPPSAGTVEQAFQTTTAARADYPALRAHGGCRILVTEKVFLDRALDVRASGTTALRTIVCLDGGDETTLSWQELIECRQPAAGGENGNADYQVNAPSDRGRDGAEIEELNTK